MPYTVFYEDTTNTPSLTPLNVTLLFDGMDAFHTHGGVEKAVERIEVDLAAAESFVIDAWPKPTLGSATLDTLSASCTATSPGSGSARWVATSRIVGGSTELGQQITLGSPKATGVEIDWTFNPDQPPMKLKVIIRQP